MKTIIKAPKVNLSNDMFVLAADIGKDEVHWVFKPVALANDESAGIQAKVANQTDLIRGVLTTCHEKTGNLSSRIVVACESTGVYHRKLMKMARELGMQTVLVNGKAVNRLGVFEENDNGKADPRDPRVIYRLVLVKAGLLTDRDLAEAYARLREQNEAYDFESREAATLRCRLPQAVLKLFPDFCFDNDWIEGPIGRAFFELYRFNPWSASMPGKAAFQDKMRQQVKDFGFRVQQRTLDKLWTSIIASVSGCRPPAKLLKDREEFVHALLNQLAGHEKRKTEIKKTMLEIYEEIKEAKTLASLPLQKFEKAKIIAETGPLDDYKAARQLLRMAGLTIRIRESGKHKGLSKITKTGRSLLRKVLYQIVFGDLGRKHGMFCQRNLDLKDQRKGRQKTPGKGKKRMIQFMRKLLTAIFAVHKSRIPFNQERLFKQDAKKKAA